MNLSETLRKKLTTTGQRLVLPEGHDDRILRAADRLRKTGIAHPVVLGSPEVIAARLRELSLSPSIEISDPHASSQLDDYCRSYVESRPRTRIRVARRLLLKPLLFAGMMVKQGHAAAMLAGVDCATARVIESGQLTIGLAADLKTPSSYFIMMVPGENGRSRSLIFADCAVNIEPDASQLADIAIASAISARRSLDDEPRVAFLSFSTQGSAKHPSVDKVREALELARKRNQEFCFDGEFQADSALVQSVAEIKCKDASGVAGRANVLIFPDLNAGNIAYKLTQHLAKAVAIGPLLQGFAKPIGDLSRGASVDDIVNTAIVLLSDS